MSFHKAYAHESQRGKIMASLGPFLYQTELKRDIKDTDPPLLGGFGLVVEGGVDKNGGVELGMFYLHKMYYRTSQGYAIAEKIKRIYMTIGYRHWFNKYFSIAGAYYTAYAVGDPRLIHNDFPGAPDITTSAHKVSENGFDVSLQYEFIQKQKYSIVADTRYSLSISNRDHEDANHYGLLISYKRQIEAK